MKAKHAFACDITMLGPFCTTPFRYFDMEMLYAEAVVRRCSVNKVSATLLKRDSGTGVFM